MEQIMQIIKLSIDWLTSFVYSNNILISISCGMFLVILESIIPALPLALFIAINTVVFGNIVGFLISWIGTVIGCSLSFFIFRTGFSKRIYHNIENRIKTKKLMNKISNLNFTTLVLIMAIPFTPAFSVNIGAGLSKMPYKKYLFALLISKLSIIYFWGYIGSTFLDSITDIGVLIKLAIILFVTFILSQIVIKKSYIT